MCPGRLPRKPAAVDDDHSSGNVVTGGRGDEEGGTGKIVRFTPAAGGNAIENLSVARLVLLQRGSVLRSEVAGSDGVDLHIARSPLVSQSFGHLRDAAFGGDVGGDTNASLKRHHGGDVDDLSPAAVQHLGSGKLAQAKGAGEIHLEDPHP